MNLTEQLLARREIYHGRIIDVQVDTVSLPNGNTSTREVVRHPGGVGILALDDEDCAVLVEQYRYVFGRTLLEIPAGKREPGEDPADYGPAGTEGGDRRRGHSLAAAGSRSAFSRLLRRGAAPVSGP